jgi:hypothetical protein
MITLGPVNRSVCQLQAKARLESQSKSIRRHRAIKFYRDEFADPPKKVPQCILPFIDEITAFCNYSLPLREPTSPHPPLKALELPND